MILALRFTLSSPKSLTFLHGTVAGCSQEEEGDGRQSHHDACGERVEEAGDGELGEQKVLGQWGCHGEKERAGSALRAKLDPS